MFAPGIATTTVPFARDLATHGDLPALVTIDGELSYRDLAGRVGTTAERLGTTRRLVMLAATNTVDSIVTYLAALSTGHPLLIVPPDQAAVDALSAVYDPDVLVTAQGLTERREGTVHDLHPDLALLMSTSGSTGAAKLVRLSHGNLQSNAEAIAGYLGIRAEDRAATTLPMHYCYGLSVINSQLVRGASLWLTEQSVADTEFWGHFRDLRATTFAGVPHTFELLDRTGFEHLQLPKLRYVTQAGGRMDPDRVRRYAQLGQRDGWDLYVMYGQTEATARMAYLPPDLVLSFPQCVGVPIPGGVIDIDPAEGELVYSGPNVMLGYARSPADLALGRTVTELRTGDLARRTTEGLIEIIGRRSDFIKLFGLRIDPRQVEAALARHGITALCAEADEKLGVLVAGTVEVECVQRVAAREAGLPAFAVRVKVTGELPRLPNGKPDYRSAVASLRREAEPEPVSDVRDLFIAVLGPDQVSDDRTFTDLGGDSLSYVEMSIRLERLLGHLPANWHLTPIRDLRSAPARRPRLELGIALRAVAIVLVVGTHAKFWAIAGGAHLLLAVAGFNFGRFQVASGERMERVRKIGRSAWRIALASATWITLVVLVTGNYSWAQAFLVNYIFGPQWKLNDFWFIETLVYIMVALAALLCLPGIDRFERRHPFAMPMAVMLVGLITRYELIPGVKLPTPLLAFWLFALGWAMAKTVAAWQRILVTVAAVATVPGFFGDLKREAFIMVGLVLIVWVPAIPSTRWINRFAGVLAGSSLYIYLIHWQVFPHLKWSPLLAVIASLGAGVAYASLAAHTGRWYKRFMRRHTILPPPPVR